MSASVRQMHLAVNVHAIGFSPAAWLMAGDNALGSLDPDHFVRVARTAERGHLDAFFLADGFKQPFALETGIIWGLDPLLTLATVAAATEHIGLIGSVSTTFNVPYIVARWFASLDHLSRGRASWNVVTTYDDDVAVKFGRPHLPDPQERYRRAAEFVDVVLALLDSWEPEAIVLDRERRVFADPDRIRSIDHHGEFFDVQGSLQLPGPPQGRLPLFQAGASVAGREMAARYASGVFSAQHTLRGARAAYDDQKQRVANHARSPEDLKILPGVTLVVADSDAAAAARAQEARELLGENESVAEFLAMLGIDLPASAYDRPIPPEVREVFARGFLTRGFDRATLDLIDERPQITPRELTNAGGSLHRTVVGGPERIADDLQEWFEAGAGDGFVLMFDLLPEGLEAFVDHVVPLLVERGLFRSEYEGSTLRDHLGLTSLSV
jgi:FMN-dependent oxidoreductase (nitrilotriacetate monooxygenase family)